MYAFLQCWPGVGLVVHAGCVIRRPLLPCMCRHACSPGASCAILSTAKTTVRSKANVHAAQAQGAPSYHQQRLQQGARPTPVSHYQHAG
eukprot:1160352-Pelagomonas_calceolata.AAC.5